MKLQDRLLGEALTLGSAVSSRVPKLFGQADGFDKNFVPLRWKLNRHYHLEDTDHRHFLAFAGNAASGNLPSQYIDAAVISMDRETVERATHQCGGAKHAVSYILGESAVMYGTARTDEIFTPDVEAEDRLVVAMRIGKGTLQTLPGLVRNGQFDSSPDFDFQAVRLPLAHVPEHVPVV